MSRLCCLFCIPLEWMQNYEYISNGSKNNYLSTIVLLLNSMIGSGIIVQGFVFRTSGILGASLMYLKIGYLTYTGVKMLFDVASHQSTCDYNELAQRALGPYGDAALNLSIALGNFGSSVSYIFLIDSLIMNVLVEFIGESALVVGTELRIFISLMTVCIIVPTCLIKNFGRFAYISYISMAAISGIILLVVVRGLSSFLFEKSSSGNGDIHLISPGGMLRSLGSVVFAFGYANAIFHAHAAMQDPPHGERRVEYFTSILQRVTTIGVFACYVTGFVGYLSFREETKPDILENFAGILSILFKATFILHLVSLTELLEKKTLLICEWYI